MSDSERLSRSGGFSIVESLLSLMLVGTVMMLLGPSIFNFANERVTVDATSQLDVVLRGETSRLVSLPFANLDAQAGCATVSDSELPHERCITVTTISQWERDITIIVTPSSSLVQSDTAAITRTDREVSPFHTAMP